MTSTERSDRAPARRALRAAGSVLGSPLGVAVATGLCVGVWSLAYRSVARMPSASAQAPATELASTVDVPIPPNARRRATNTESAAVTGPRPVPRLRVPFAPTGLPGLEIAIQDRDGRSMSQMQAALARAQRGEGQARLVFYGASHTAADIYTGYVRNALQTMFGDAGHGFVLPVQPWRGYHHEGVHVARMSADWTTIKVGTAATTTGEEYFGLAGVAVETSVPEATAYVETEHGAAIGSHVAHFDVYYLKQPGGGSFDVLLDGRRIERIRTGASSREAGYVEVAADPDGEHRLELRVVGNGPVRLFGVALERDTPGVVVDVNGINGSRARNQLYWNEDMFREQLRRRNPDLVALAYGTNESGDDNQPIADYEAQLDQVVRRVRDTVPGASCLLIGPSDRPVAAGDEWVDRPRTAQIIETQWRVALANGCGFFDTVAFQGGSMSTVTWASMDPPYAGRDHVHFTRRGYERMGQVLLGAMLEGTSYTVPSIVDFEMAEPSGL